MGQDAVITQLDKILASAHFAQSRRLSRFLRLVVEETLGGKADRLKEYRIGVEVFDRGTDFDPRLDSIVRMQAAKLRSGAKCCSAGVPSTVSTLTCPRRQRTHATLAIRLVAATSPTPSNICSLPAFPRSLRTN